MTYLWTAVLSLLPISELRGGIPFALYNGIPWYIAFPFATAVNTLIPFICWLFLSTIHRIFYGTVSDTAKKPAWSGFSWYRLLFDRFIERARHKLRGGVEKWGALGIAIFVAIPLPTTGAWTGTIGAWVLGLSKRKTVPAIILGVIIAGIIVTLVCQLGLGAFRIFIKTVSF